MSASSIRGHTPKPLRYARVPPDTYNPLDILEADDPNATSIAQALAGAICPVEEGRTILEGQRGDLLAAVFFFLPTNRREEDTRQGA